MKQSDFLSAPRIDTSRLFPFEKTARGALYNMIINFSRPFGTAGDDVIDVKSSALADLQ